jgi:uncharacterized membrane protein YeaQ/YmgE (transglycosylase-associated protein family)
MIPLFIFVVTALLATWLAGVVVPGRTPGGKLGALGFGVLGAVSGFVLYYALYAAGILPSKGPVALSSLLVLSVAATAAILYALRLRAGRRSSTPA